ncbi:MAG: hypothetical protein AB1403_23565 [Candidatus Riflebacteria bacterium]
MTNTQLINELKAELAEVKEAIKKAQRVQSWSSSGTAVTAGNLKHLYEREKDLMSRIARLSGSRIIKTPVFGDAK